MSCCSLSPSHYLPFYFFLYMSEVELALDDYVALRNSQMEKLNGRPTLRLRLLVLLPQL